MDLQDSLLRILEALPRLQQAAGLHTTAWLWLGLPLPGQSDPGGPTSLQRISGIALTPEALKAGLVQLAACLVASGAGLAPSALDSGGAATPVAELLQADPVLLDAVLCCVAAQLPAHLLACPAEEAHAESYFGDGGALLVAANRGMEVLHCLLMWRLVEPAEAAAVVKQYVCVFDRFSRLLPPECTSTLGTALLVTLTAIDSFNPAVRQSFLADRAVAASCFRAAEQIHAESAHATLDFLGSLEAEDLQAMVVEGQLAAAALKSVRGCVTQYIKLLRQTLGQHFPGGSAQWRLANMWVSAWDAYHQLTQWRLLLLVLPEGPGNASCWRGTTAELNDLLIRRLPHTPARELQPVAGLLQEVAQMCAIALHAVADLPWDGMLEKVKEVYTEQAGTRIIPFLSLVLCPVAVIALSVAKERAHRVDRSQPFLRRQDAWLWLAAGPGGVAPLLALAESMLRLLAKWDQLTQLLGGHTDDIFLDGAWKSVSVVGQYILEWLAPSGEPLGEHRGLLGGGEEETAAQLAAVRGLAATALKLARREHVGGGELQLFAELMVWKALGVAAKVLQHHPAAAPGEQRNLTLFLREAGFIPFGLVPALADLATVDSVYSSGAGDIERATRSHLSHALHWLAELGMTSEAVRSGLGAALTRMVARALVECDLAVATTLLEDCAACCRVPGSESLVVGIASPQGLLAAVCSWWLEQGSAQQAAAQGNVASSFLRLAHASSGLFKACCAALDAAAGTQLASTHAALLQPSAKNKRLKATSPAFWKGVRSSLLPDLERICQDAAASTAHCAEQDGMFRDISLSFTCANPGCTNVWSTNESELQLKPCGGCREARYCSRSCQRADWRRHKPVCAAIKAAK